MSAPAPARERGGRGMFRSLRIRNYRLYAAGQVVSLTGTWMQRIAQDWLVLELSDSATALGIVLALQFGPTLLFSLWGGVLADRYDKRRLLILTQAAMALVAFALGLLDVTGLVVLWHVYVLAALLGVASAIDMPVRQAFVAEIVGRDELTNAVGLNSATFNTARIVGPAVAGFMINWSGTGWVFLVNAASTAAVLAGLYAMRVDELLRSPPIRRARGQLREGLRYVRLRPDLMVAFALVFVIGTFGMKFQLTLATLARGEFGRGAEAYGLLSTALAVGALVGALLSTRRIGRPGPRFLLGSALAFSVLETAVGLLPAYEAVLVMLVPTGAATLLFTVAANSSVQLGVDETMRGRVMALYLLCFMGGAPFGGPMIGVLSDAFGPRAGLVVGGGICGVATAVVAVLAARHRPAPAPVPVPAAARQPAATGPATERRRPPGTDERGEPGGPRAAAG